MAAERCMNGNCPPSDELDQLIHGQLDDLEATAVTEHVGQCSGCQERMDSLADDVNTTLSRSLRHIDENSTPEDSALWPALSAAEAELLASTAAFMNGVADGSPQGELTLDFLKPSQTAGRLGILGAFEVVRVVGRGGMGVVLHGFDNSLQRDVAIKVIDPLLAGNSTARQRFCREARAAAAVTHENLVAVHQVTEDESSGLPYLIMQLVNGESLDQRLKRVGKMSAPEVARLGMQAAAGLAAAHAGGLIHRDIKPGNILLESGSDRVKLTDFGLARAAEDVKLTRTGFVAGSPLYMAPEQARGDAIDARADLFSLGSVLYEAASGAPPFDGKTPLAVLRRVADETQPPLRRLDPKVPQWLSDVIDRLLAKDPADRFQTASEVAEIFATELTRWHSISPLDVPAEMCGGTSAYALKPRKHICWKSVSFRTLPWLGGAAIGVLAMAAFWPGAKPAPNGLIAPAPAGVAVAESGPIPRIVIDGNKAGPVWAIAFSPDGDTLVVGAEDGTLNLWDWKKKALRRSLPKMGGNVWSTDVSSNGRFLVASSDDAEVKVYDLKTNQSSITLAEPTSTKAAIFSPDGEKLATGDRSSTIRVWDLELQVPIELRGHHGTVNGLAFCPIGKMLASAASDGSVKLWDTEVNLEPQSLQQHTGPVYSVAFGASEKRAILASAGWDGTVKLWNPKNGDLLQTLKGHDGDVWSVTFAPDGKTLASAGSDSTVRLWDAGTGKQLQVYRGNGREFQVVRFTPDGSMLAAGSRDGNVWVWDVSKP